MRRAALVSICLAVAGPASAQEPTLQTVLARAGVYVADFHRRLSSIVAEERYVQDWKVVRQGLRHGTTDLAHRELLSDLLLVKPAGAAAWMEFRDVFEVDGSPVRERDERLVKMFLEPSPSTSAQIATILEESARFNIGDIRRNVNTPIFRCYFWRRRIMIASRSSKRPTAGRRRSPPRAPRLTARSGCRPRSG